MKCACVDYCGDVPEQDDDPHAVCKCLPEPPREAPLQLRIVHRNAADMLDPLPAIEEGEPRRATGDRHGAHDVLVASVAIILAGVAALVAAARAGQFDQRPQVPSRPTEPKSRRDA